MIKCKYLHLGDNYIYCCRGSIHPCVAGRWVTYPFVFCIPLYFVRDSSKDSYVRSGTENGVNTPRIRGFLSRRRLGILYTVSTGEL
jgi:hypothetical protein